MNINRKSSPPHSLHRSPRGYTHPSSLPKNTTTLRRRPLLPHLHPLVSVPCARMDRRPAEGSRGRKRAREDPPAPADFPFDEAAADPGGEAWRRPPGVFQFPWQKCRGGLGVAGGGWELRDVFFRSLVDGGAAAIGVPGDRLVSPPSKQQRALFDDVDAWLAAAGDGEVDSVWRSAIRGGGGHSASPV